MMVATRNLGFQMADTAGTEQNIYEGLGGWLLVVAFGMMVSLGRNVFDTYNLFAPYADLTLFRLLFDRSSEAYSPGLGVLIIVELLLNLLFMVLNCVALVFFFQKRVAFPKLYVCWLVGSTVVLILDTIVAGQFLPPEQAYDKETITNIGRGIFACLIWVPYMAVSKRVAATFVN
jgi:hypothetical protein